jgi:hypothetical protein
MMERSTALRRLRKILGKDFGYQVNTSSIPRDLREDEKPEFEAAVKRRERAQAELTRMRTEHMTKLEATAEYKAAQEELRQCREKASELGGRQMMRRFTVGTANRLFFHVDAQGDTWEEVFAELQRKGKIKGGA